MEANLRCGWLASTFLSSARKPLGADRSTSTRTDLNLRGVEEMQTEANVVRAYRQLPNGFRSCEAVRLKLADEGQDISAEKIRDVIRVMAAIECKTDNIVRAANTLRRVLELGELSEVAPAARHMQDAEDILFALKPLPTEWAFRELRQALALVFAAAEHLRECNRQLDHADKIDALREQRKEHDAVKTTQEPSPSAKE